MAALKLVLAALALALAVPAKAGDLRPWRGHIEEASARFGIPVAWIERVMDRESGGRLTLGGRPIVSSAGAMGLMQLMPGTWTAMRRELGLGADPHEPRDNILAGTLYLRLMYERFGYPGLFGAYNAGPARYAEFVERGRPLPAETRAYLAATARPVPPPILSPPIPARSTVRGAAGGIFFALIPAKSGAALCDPDEGTAGAVPADETCR